MQTPIVLRVLRAGAGGQRRLLAASTALALLGVVVDLVRPWPLAFAVDHAIGTDGVAGLSPTAILIVAGVAIVAVTTVFGLIDLGAVVSAERAAERIGATLRRDVFDHALALSPRWHDRMRSGELVSRLSTDVGRLLDAVVALTTTLLPDALRICLVLGVLAVLDLQLAIVALAVVPALAAFAVAQRRRVRAVQEEARASSGRLASTATDLIRNVRAVQAFGRSRRSSGTFGARNTAVLAVNTRAVAVEARWTPVADVVLAVGSGLVLVVGGRQAVNGTLSTGDLLVVMSYLSSLYSPIRALSRLSGLLAKSSASAARIDEVLASTERIEDRPGARALPGVRDEIRFAGVTFGYRPGRPVLTDLDLTLHVGETLAVIGSSGCGKSTALSLLLRLYDVDAGAITVDGVDVRDLRHADLRRQIAFVPQDAWLLDASIAENIGFGASSATRHEILGAGRIALVDEIAARLPRGYDSVVGEGGGTLSGGERRRIALARAVVSDAPVVLLDEPTASLDPANALVLVKAVRRATAGRTVLLVTHDLALAATCDRVVDLSAPRPPVAPDDRSPVLAGREVTS